jgi:hypothetical protein
LDGDLLYDIPDPRAEFETTIIHPPRECMCALRGCQPRHSMSGLPCAALRLFLCAVDFLIMLY